MCANLVKNLKNFSSNILGSRTTTRTTTTTKTTISNKQEAKLKRKKKKHLKISFKELKNLIEKFENKNCERKKKQKHTNVRKCGKSNSKIMCWKLKFF